MNRIHCVKCWVGVFDDVKAGRKPFEYRLNDRDYQVGDCLILQEYNPETDSLTGEAFAVRVTYLLPGGKFGVPEKHCIMAIEPWGVDSVSGAPDELREDCLSLVRDALRWTDGTITTEQFLALRRALTTAGFQVAPQPRPSEALPLDCLDEWPPVARPNEALICAGERVVIPGEVEQVGEDGSLEVMFSARGSDRFRLWFDESQVHRAPRPQASKPRPETARLRTGDRVRWRSSRVDLGIGTVERIAHRPWVRWDGLGHSVEYNENDLELYRAAPELDLEAMAQEWLERWVYTDGSDGPNLKLPLMGLLEKVRVEATRTGSATGEGSNG